MRRFVFLIASLLLAAVPGGEAQAQTGFDRRGGDYSNFQVRSGDPAICATRCERDNRCRAWSFSYSTGRNSAVCWLKNEVSPRVEDQCCVSGVRGAGVDEPKTGPFEFSIDRVGGDYRNATLPPSPSGEACKAMCEADNKCRAWTYVRPGYLGASARCFLKSEIKRPRKKPCCISGVVR